MSTALLKFQPSGQAQKEMPLDPEILAAALELLPEPTAVIENGKLIYANRSFAQLTTQSAKGIPTGRIEAAAASMWQNTAFAVGARTFSLTTLRRELPQQSGSDATHLEMVGRLVAGVAHDFNNLLTGILLYCDLMKTQLTSAHPMTRKIDEIRYAAEQGAGLIRQLMTVGREEQGAPRWVSFNHGVEEIVPLLRHLLGEHIAVSVNLDAGAPRVGLSLAEAQQLILNLVLNARDAMPAGGEIRLETRHCEFAAGRGSGALEFTVSDSGAGMDAETAAHIFEPFYTTKVLGSGTGLGLFTVKRIVENAGGLVFVDTAPGKGTRVTVRLPQIELSKIEGDDQATARQPDNVRCRPQRSESKQTQAHQSPNRGAGL